MKLCKRFEPISRRRRTSTYLVTTAPIFKTVSFSTLNIRPIPRVKKPNRWPGSITTHASIGKPLPLILDNTVALATLVKARDAFTVQLATNQKKQKIMASCAVSFTVNGAMSGPRLDLTMDSSYVRRRVSMTRDIQSRAANLVLVIIHCKWLVFFARSARVR